MTRTKFWALALAALIGLGAFSVPQTAEAGRGWYGPGWRGGYWGPRRGYWGPGPAWGAGLVGLGVGLAVGSALAGPVYVGPPPPPVYAPPPPGPVPYAPAAYGPPPGTPEWYSYCSQRYRSFNPQTGTFLGYDGLQHPCQ